MLMEILTIVRRLYIRFKSLVNDFVYSFGRAALLLLVEVQNHTVPVRERRRIRAKMRVLLRFSVGARNFSITKAFRPEYTTSSASYLAGSGGQVPWSQCDRRAAGAPPPSSASYASAIYFHRHVFIYAFQLYQLVKPGQFSRHCPQVSGWTVEVSPFDSWQELIFCSAQRAGWL